jgi:hypothetical protein
MKSRSIDRFTTFGPISLLSSESILEALNEIGDSKDCDKGYDSEEYDAAMKKFEAQLALEGLEKNQVAAIASRPYVQQFRLKKGCMKVNTTSAVHKNLKKGGEVSSFTIRMDVSLLERAIFSLYLFRNM